MASPAESERVAHYFDTHAEDFDTIYEERKGFVRGLRDRLSRGTVVERLAFVRALAADRTPRTVLDVGCGAGRFALPLAAAGASVVGLDFAAEMAAMAAARAKEQGLGDRCRFLTEDFLSWNAGEHFDLSLAIGVLDYIRDPAPLIGKMAADTRGTVVLSFPRRSHVLVPLRKVRLGLAGCPVFFYTRSYVERLGGAHFASFEVSKLGRDFMLVGAPG